MPQADPIANVLHVAGIYQRIKAYELKGALSPDPRLLLGDVPADERVALAAQRYAPTALSQPDALLYGLPVRVPRWYLGGRSYPEVRGWAPYDSRRVKWFTIGPDDTITPGGPDSGGFPSERTVKRTARRTGYR